MNDLNDDKLFEYLMTSDFIENYKPTEWKFLLLKFRSFYKLFRGSKEQELIEKEQIIKQLKNQVDSLNNQLSQEKIKSSELQNKIDLSKKKRKLTWKERFNGETETFKDEQI